MLRKGPVLVFQADIASLMSALIGANFPVNSVVRRHLIVCMIHNLHLSGALPGNSTACVSIRKGKL